MEAMVLEGDILESHGNIGNSGRHRIVCCLPYRVQTQFPLKIQKCTGRHGKVSVANGAFPCPS